MKGLTIAIILIFLVLIGIGSYFLFNSLSSNLPADFAINLGSWQNFSRDQTTNPISIYVAYLVFKNNLLEEGNVTYISHNPGKRCLDSFNPIAQIWENKINQEGKINEYGNETIWINVTSFSCSSFFSEYFTKEEIEEAIKNKKIFKKPEWKQGEIPEIKKIYFSIVE
ncbi:hypothetical protein HYW76_00780 [Candidatus Pacearchaeota archaeon]|nr:hypothetical protein [Candidatus Pacearchaeota archaeon]